MTDITSSCTIKKGWLGEILVLQITTPATAATSDTIDLDSDIANGKGAIMATIKNTYLQDDAGTNVADCAFDPDTGIITLPAISTGIHDIVVMGI